MKPLLLCLFLIPSLSLGTTVPSLSKQATTSEITAFIATTAQLYGIDPKLALYISNKESSWSPEAVGDHGTSFGIWQIHNPTKKKKRPLTIKQAKDPAISTFWAMQTMKEDGDCHQWSTCPKDS